LRRTKYQVTSRKSRGEQFKVQSSKFKVESSKLDRRKLFNSSPRPPSLRRKEGGVQAIGLLDISYVRQAVTDPANLGLDVLL